VRAFGVTKRGRNTKIHAVVDDQCRPLVLILTSGNAHDCVVAQPCVSLIHGVVELIADKAITPTGFAASSVLRDQVGHPRQIQSQGAHSIRKGGSQKSAVCFVAAQAYWV
jgi:hypothetical protein